MDYYVRCKKRIDDGNIEAKYDSLTKSARYIVGGLGLYGYRTTFKGVTVPLNSKEDEKLYDYAEERYYKGMDSLKKKTLEEL